MCSNLFQHSTTNTLLGYDLLYSKGPKTYSMSSSGNKSAKSIFTEVSVLTAITM